MKIDRNNFKELVRFANHLDNIGLTKEADIVDGLLKKEAMLWALLASLWGCGGGKCKELANDHLVWWFNEGNIEYTLEAEVEDILISGICDENGDGNCDQYDSFPGDFKRYALIYEEDGVKVLKASFRKITWDPSSLTVGESIYQGRTHIMSLDNLSLESIVEDLKNFEKNGSSSYFGNNNVWQGGDSELTLYFPLIVDDGVASYDRPLDQLKMDSMINSDKLETSVMT